MTDVIFARTRHEYDSYSDMRRLVELSDYPLIYVDELDPQSDNCYILITLNGEWNVGWKSPKARIIWWDLEWRKLSEYPTIPGVSEVWVSDQWYADRVGAKYVLLGSHPGLNLHPEDERSDFRYDVIMLAYMTHRRQRIADELAQRGLTVAPNAWGEDRHRLLNQSRIMLHVHQHNDVATIAPQRWALAAAYRIPLTSERVYHPGVYPFSSHTLIEYDYLTGHIAMQSTQFKNGHSVNARAENLYAFLCVENTFRKCVEGSL